MHVSIVGPFPAPVHGMAVINSRIAERLEQIGVGVKRIDTAPPQRGCLRKLGRINSVAKAYGQLHDRPCGQDQVAWFSLSGGLGKVYELALVRAARRIGMRVVLHHHAWTYVRRKSALMAALTRAAGRNHVQIALCENMARRLEELYRPPDLRVISNLAFLDPPTVVEKTEYHAGRGARVFGYLSNITIEKGLLLALEFGRRILDLNPECRFVIAGPIREYRARRIMQRALFQNDRMEYAGPVYGREKEEFFQNIDVMIFPSLYRNETEPLVVLEAMTHGVPVIATDLGCTKEMLGGDGCAFSRTKFLEMALEVADRLIKEPLFYRQNVRRVRNLVARRRDGALGVFENLIKELM